MVVEDLVVVVREVGLQVTNVKYSKARGMLKSFP
jgi:hypothetical protein